MSLTATDLDGIRNLLRIETPGIIKEELRTAFQTELPSAIRNIVKSELSPLEVKIDQLDGKVEALEADVKDIYHMIKTLQKKTANIA